MASYDKVYAIINGPDRLAVLASLLFIEPRPCSFKQAECPSVIFKIDREVYSADRGINSDEVQVNLSAIDVINASTGEFFFRGNVTHLKKTFVEGHFKISNRTGQISFDASVSTESWWTRLGLRHTFRNAVD